MNEQNGIKGWGDLFEADTKSRERLKEAITGHLELIRLRAADVAVHITLKDAGEAAALGVLLPLGYEYSKCVFAIALCFTALRIQSLNERINLKKEIKAFNELVKEGDIII